MSGNRFIRDYQQDIYEYEYPVYSQDRVSYGHNSFVNKTTETFITGNYKISPIQTFRKVYPQNIRLNHRPVYSSSFYLNQRNLPKMLNRTSGNGTYDSGNGNSLNNDGLTINRSTKSLPTVQWADQNISLSEKNQIHYVPQKKSLWKKIQKRMELQTPSGIYISAKDNKYHQIPTDSKYTPYCLQKYSK